MVRFASTFRWPRARTFFVLATVAMAGVNASAQSLVDSQRNFRKHSDQKLGYAVAVVSDTSLDADAKPTWGLGALVMYAVNPRVIATAEADFQSLYAREDADPKLNEGVGDAAFSLYWRSAFTDPRFGRLSALTSVNLPTSEVSRRQSKIVGTRSYIQLATPFPDALYRLSLISQLTLDLNHFQYDLASKRGGEFNSPIRTGETLGLALQLSRSLSWQNLYTYAQRYDYGHKWTSLQSFASQAVLQVTQEVRATAAYRWADRVYTEDLPFNPRQSSLSGEISYAF